MFSDEQKKQLAAKLHPSAVKSRSQAGRNLSYIEGWHAIAEANRIFGFDGWHRYTTMMECVRPAEVVKNDKGYENWRVGYMAQVRVTVGSVIREGTGFGSGIDKDRGQAVESAIKEAETDAMKRALMTFGNPFGLALYDKDKEGVGDDEPQPTNSKAASRADYSRLSLALKHATNVADLASLWVSEQPAIRLLPPDWQRELTKEKDAIKAALMARVAA